MKIKLSRIDNDFRIKATNENGSEIITDGAISIGGHENGFRPMQLLLAAVGSCSAIDIISILKKQKQSIDSFDVEVDGERKQIEEYSLFNTIFLHFKIKGQVDKDKAERAVQLSIEKYCSVAKTLEPTAKITYRVTVN